MKITHVWPHVSILQEQERVGGDDTEKDVLEEVRRITLRDGAVLLLESHQYALEMFREELVKDRVDLSRVQVLSAVTKKKKIHTPAQKEHWGQDLVSVAELRQLPGMKYRRRRLYPAKPAASETIERKTFWKLDNAQTVQVVTSAVRESNGVKSLVKFLEEPEENEAPIKALVIWEPYVEAGDLDCLPELQKACPNLDVYIFHSLDETKWGVEYEGDAAPDAWRKNFHTHEEALQIPAIKWIFRDFMEQFDKFMLGGLSGHGKTLIFLDMCRALMTLEKLFGYFETEPDDHKILYLIPEEGFAKFIRRMKLFGLVDYMKDDRFLLRTLSKGQTLSLTDPIILRAAEGRHTFLDTAIRFGAGDESSAGDNQNLANSIFALEQAGAASVSGAHHSPKSFAKDNYMDLENVLRGTGDIGAMVTTAYGVRQLDRDRSRTWLHIENIKPRDIDPPGPFQLEGKPSITQGKGFRMVSKPGETGSLSEYLDGKGKPSSTGDIVRCTAALELIQGKKSARDLGNELSVNHSTVLRWATAYKKEAEALKKDVVEFLEQQIDPFGLKKEKQTL